LYNAVSCDREQIFAVLRLHEAEQLLGVLNVGPHKQTITLSLPVDSLGLPDGAYALREVLGGALWVEEGQRAWNRDELLMLKLTLEPFSAYCFALEAVGNQAPPVEQHLPGLEADGSTRAVAAALPAEVDQLEHVTLDEEQAVNTKGAHHPRRRSRKAGEAG
jgi:hypothetical protein